MIFVKKEKEIRLSKIQIFRQIMEQFYESEEIPDSEFVELSQSQSQPRAQPSSGSEYVPDQELDQTSETESLDSQVY